MPDDYRACYAAFFQDHPEALAGLSVQPGAEGEPELFLNMATLRSFLCWVLGQGLAPDVAKVLRLLDALPDLEAQARAAHEARRTAHDS